MNEKSRRRFFGLGGSGETPRDGTQANHTTPQDHVPTDSSVVVAGDGSASLSSPVTRRLFMQAGGAAPVVLPPVAANIVDVAASSAPAVGAPTLLSMAARIAAIKKRLKYNYLSNSDPMERAKEAISTILEIKASPDYHVVTEQDVKTGFSSYKNIEHLHSEERNLRELLCKNNTRKPLYEEALASVQKELREAAASHGITPEGLSDITGKHDGVTLKNGVLGDLSTDIQRLAKEGALVSLKDALQASDSIADMIVHLLNDVSPENREEMLKAAIQIDSLVHEITGKPLALEYVEPEPLPISELIRHSADRWGIDLSTLDIPKQMAEVPANTADAGTRAMIEGTAPNDSPRLEVKPVKAEGETPKAPEKIASSNSDKPVPTASNGAGQHDSNWNDLDNTLLALEHNPRWLDRMEQHKSNPKNERGAKQ